MNRRILPITFFENFRGLIAPIDSHFFETYVDDIYGRIKNCINKLDKTKDKSTLLALKSWHEFCIKIQEGQLEKIHQSIDKLQSKKKITQNEVANDLYIANTTIEKGRNSRNSDLLPIMLETMWDFNDAGRKLFKVEEQLTHELFLTDVSNIDDLFLELPFNCICFHLPYNNKLTIKDKILEWVYVTQFEEEDTKIVRCLYIAGEEILGSHEFEFKGDEIYKQIKQQSDELWKSSKLARLDALNAFSFIVAALLYMSSDKADTKIVMPIVINKTIDSKYPVCSVGSSISKEKGLRYISGEGVEDDENSREFKIVKWTVRGHFRKQPIGERREQRKIIWIRPFLKGRERENGDVSIKPSDYILDSKQKRGHEV